MAKPSFAAPWQTLNRTLLVDRKFLRVYQDSVQLPNGVVLDDFCVTQSPSWVSVVCVTTEGRVLMVEQYRHGIARSCLELPGGVIEPGEDPELAARRELGEETGFVAKHWRRLTMLHCDPSRQTTSAHFYVARDAAWQQPQTLDESEAIEVRALTAQQVIEAIDAGQFVHGVQVAAFFLALHRGWVPR